MGAEVQSGSDRSEELQPPGLEPSDQPVPVAVRVLAIAVVFLGVVAAVWGFAEVDVCDGEVTNSGNVVSVCRHLTITDPPVVAVGFLMLAAMGAFFSEVSGLGFALKREVRRASAKAESAKRAAQRAAGAAAGAEQVADFAESLSRSGRDLAATERRAPASDSRDIEAMVNELATRYNAARKDMPSGTQRTREMTRITSDMVNLLSEVQPQDFDVVDYLNNQDRGRRLAGYAFIYANPDPRLTQAVVDALLREDKPFGQYWGLRALQSLVEISPRSLDRNSARELEAFEQRVGYGTDRWHAVRRVLDEWRQDESSDD